VKGPHTALKGSSLNLRQYNAFRSASQYLWAKISDVDNSGWKAVDNEEAGFRGSGLVDD
jgi:hypothetical protein